MQNVMKITSTKTAFSTNIIKNFMHAKIIMFHVQIELQKGSVLKDALFECGDHLENTHVPLTPKP